MDHPSTIKLISLSTSNRSEQGEPIFTEGTLDWGIGYEASDASMKVAFFNKEAKNGEIQGQDRLI
jgi:hypothetical protein